MTTVLIFVAALVLFSLLWIARWRRATSNFSPDLLAQIVPVDTEALRNLLDPEEDAFLRSHLRKSDYREIRRARLGAAVRYLHGAGQNAALLVRVGQAAASGTDASLARAGRELSETAIRVRMHIPFMAARLYADMLVPGLRLSHVGVLAAYQQLCYSAREVIRLQSPTTAVARLLFNS